MNHEKLSRRLAIVADYVPLNSRLADIGSDHAYLPSYLAIQKKIEYAVAGEVVQGPYDSAVQQINGLELNELIQVRLGDGLDVIQPDDRINVITICGMGGGLIRDILTRGKNNHKLSGNELLVLQPNIGESLVRKWLSAEHYEIISEKIIEEDDKIYEIIVALPNIDARPLDSREMLFGPELLQAKNDIFYKKWQAELKTKEYILTQLNQAKQTDSDKVNKINQEIKLIKEVLA